MRVGEFYPKHFIDMSKGVEVSEEKIKEWLNFLEKSEHGVTAQSGKYLVIKNKKGDYIVCSDYKVLPQEIIQEKIERGEVLTKEIQDFLDE